jgi:gamma-butyrobetaine hydroxylase
MPMRTNNPNYFIEKLFIDNDDLVIDWNDGKRSRLYSHWLRDHCQLTTSRNPNNGQRLFSISSVLKNTYIEKANIDEKSDVCVRFQPEDYVSIFSQDWLRQNCYNLNNPFDDRSEKNKKLWKKSSFNNDLPRVKYKNFHQNDTGKLDSLRFVRDLGFCIIEGAPITEGQVLSVIAELGFTRETNYGQLFEVRTEVNPNNLAFTNMGLGSHTDNPYREPVPTVQLLHCLESSIEGGDSILVDGFNAAKILKEESSENFEVLTNNWINFRFSDGKADLRSRVPMIEINDNNEIIKVRYNNRSIDTIKLPPEKIQPFYLAYRHWSEVIERDELKIEFQLLPGEILMFDNTRVMHARTAFSKNGKRHLQGAYTDLDGLYSLLNILENQENDQD